jgi:23S rRNA maturation mini-RNase III
MSKYHSRLKALETAAQQTEVLNSIYPMIFEFGDTTEIITKRGEERRIATPEEIARGGAYYIRFEGPE